MTPEKQAIVDQIATLMERGKFPAQIVDILESSGVQRDEAKRLVFEAASRAAPFAIPSRRPTGISPRLVFVAVVCGMAIVFGVVRNLLRTSPEAEAPAAREAARPDETPTERVRAPTEAVQPDGARPTPINRPQVSASVPVAKPDPKPLLTMDEARAIAQPMIAEWLRANDYTEAEQARIERREIDFGKDICFFVEGETTSLGGKAPVRLLEVEVDQKSHEVELRLVHDCAEYLRLMREKAGSR